MFPTLALRLRSQSLWMSARTVFTFPTTEWRAYSLLTKTQRLLTSPQNWMQRLRRCLPQQRPNEWFRPRSPRSRIIMSSWKLAQPVHPIVKVEASHLANRNKQITKRNTYQMKTSTQTKPSIVFCHEIWADGSCFSKVIPPLQAEGYEVIAAQYGLDTHTGDVATVKRTLGRVSTPAILVGHSYGGAVITSAGTDDRVVGLAYVARARPDRAPAGH